MNNTWLSNTRHNKPLRVVQFICVGTDWLWMSTPPPQFKDSTKCTNCTNIYTVKWNGRRYL